VDLMAAQGAFGTDFYDRYVLRLKHRAYYRSGRLVIIMGPKCALGSHEIRPIHSTLSLGQGIVLVRCRRRFVSVYCLWPTYLVLVEKLSASGRRCPVSLTSLNHFVKSSMGSSVPSSIRASPDSSILRFK